ncbi:TetR/AcrR family transcriptional regulator [Kordiimonas aestuarii]|uniref:TetR/AcrR family transcriptional regulator n=1 Tax=Kordiimonas aestuarii TaxID=1005925 RepID=UPI0021D34829|nr:TetR/AcrR family transcriptional regulator [Kordiimonas aestuarii]
MEDRISKGELTRTRILDLAEEAVLQKGFAATSLDELISAAGITKSGFFYHFKDKSELAKHMFVRYMEREDEIFADLEARADALSDDPLHSTLILLKMLADMLADLPETHPGCLVASYCYQHQLFNDEIRRLNEDSVLTWRAFFLRRLERIAEVYPNPEVNLRAMADLALTFIEGGIILSKTLRQKELLPELLLMYRDYVRRVFSPV